MAKMANEKLGVATEQSPESLLQGSFTVHLCSRA